MKKKTLHFEGVGASQWDCSLRRRTRSRVWAIRLQPSWDLSSRSWQNVCSPENGAAAQTGRCDNSRNWQTCVRRTRLGGGGGAVFSSRADGFLSCHVLFWLTGQEIGDVYSPPHHRRHRHPAVTLVVACLCFSKCCAWNRERRLRDTWLCKWKHCEMFNTNEKELLVFPCAKKIMFLLWVLLVTAKSIRAVI